MQSLRSSWKEIIGAQKCPHIDVAEMRDPQEQQREVDLAESAVENVLLTVMAQRLKQKGPPVPQSDLKLLKTFLSILLLTLCTNL